MIRVILLVVSGAFSLLASPLHLEESDRASFDTGVAQLLNSLGHASTESLPLSGGKTLRDPQGAWTPSGLQAALNSRSDFQSGPLSDGAWLARQSVPRLLLIENASTVSPISKKLGPWRLPFAVADFEAFEAAPEKWIGDGERDFVLFSSPGWWDGFSNPPSGPSRMKDTVVNAVRRYVSAGGTACFVDLAQWDLERCWPHSLELNSLGPYQLDRFEGLGEKGKLALAPEGVAADRLYSKSAFALLSQPSFSYPDGSNGPAYAAYAFPDPNGGSGFVMGLAFHPMDQDDTLSGAALRLLINALFASGAAHLQDSSPSLAPVAKAEISKPWPSPSFSPTLIPSPPPPSATSSPLPTETERPTLAPATPTPSPTSLPTDTQIPTLPPTPSPRPTPSPWPSPIPTLVIPAPTPPPALAPAVPLLPPSLPPPAQVPTLAPPPSPEPSPASVTPELVFRNSSPSPVPSPSPVLKASPSPRPSPFVVQAAFPTPNWESTHIHDAIGCLQSAPEPFDEGGVYVYYCLKHPASIRLRVYDASGQLVYKGPPLFRLIGNHQEYYAGVDQAGVPLDQGKYLYRLEATYDNHSAEWRQSEFNLKHKKH